MEEPSILRRNINYRRLIKVFIIICSVMFVIASLVQEQLNIETKQVKTIQYAPKINELSAGVNKHVYDEPAFEVQVEKVDKVIVSTAPEEVEETQTQYKSMDEVVISRDMDLTQTLGVSREEFVEHMSNLKFDHVGFYRQNAGLIWDLSQIYQENEFFMCAVFALESGHGTSEKHIAAHNYGSIMTGSGKLVQHESDAEGIEANFKLLADEYFNPEGKYYKGVTLDAIGDTYCPPTLECPSWADRVYKCMLMFLPENN